MAVLTELDSRGWSVVDLAQLAHSARLGIVVDIIKAHCAGILGLRVSETDEVQCVLQREAGLCHCPHLAPCTLPKPVSTSLLPLLNPHPRPHPQLPLRPSRGTTLSLLPLQVQQ